MSGLEGTTLDHYELISLLGQGGMGEVYLAHDELNDRTLALKVVGSFNADYIERFHREVVAIQELKHDNILPALAYGEQGMWHYMVMPYMEFGTLRELLEEGPMSLEAANEILEQVASALQFAHDHGFIHRDIKPSNILLRQDGHAYLADFGLAKALVGASELTQTGSLLGTPEYMAPELADGPATTSSDIYALGILLYEMVTGRVPFVGETPISVYWKQIRDKPEAPSRLNTDVPPTIERVIMRALAKDPRRRYQTPMGLAQAYAHALGIASEEDASDAEYDFEEEELQRLPQEAMLILPGDPAAEPSAVSFTEDQFADDPVATRRYDAADQDAPAASPIPTRRRRLRRRRSRSNRVVVALFMALILFFVLAVVLSWIYYINSNPTSRGGTIVPSQAIIAVYAAPAYTAASYHLYQPF